MHLTVAQIAKIVADAVAAALAVHKDNTVYDYARSRLFDRDGRSISTIPTTPVEDSVTPDRLVCLIDGKRFRNLTVHLNRVHGITPDQYRQHFTLPADYPMSSASHRDTCRARLLASNNKFWLRSSRRQKRIA